MNNLALASRPLWLTSFWDFEPHLWGGVGFTEDVDRRRFLRSAPPGSLMAIYVTRNRGPEDARGKVVGVLEMTHEIAAMQDFTSPTVWAAAQRDAGTVNKWGFGVAASRAWRIAPEHWLDVEVLFPSTYSRSKAESIGRYGIEVLPDDRDRLFDLTMMQTTVYRREPDVPVSIGSLTDLLTPSRAIHPGFEPRVIDGFDGPKHLYILRLMGNYAHFLGCAESDVQDKHIIKVGFSKSPFLRRDQIQSAYPKGAFEWTVYLPEKIPDQPPFPDAAAAIRGEDAMKKRLKEEGARSLGGEFFLADDGMVVRTWNAGRFTAP